VSIVSKPRADAAHDAEARQRRGRPRSVIGAYCSRMPRASFAAAITSSSVLHCATVEPDAVALEEVALERDVVVVVVGEQDRGHRRRGAARDAASCRGPPKRSKRPEPPAQTASPRHISRGVQKCAAMTNLLSTTIAGSLPQARLAWPSRVKLWAPWRLEGEALAAGKRDAVRLVLATRSAPGSTSSPTASRRAGTSSRRSSSSSTASTSRTQDGAHPQPLRRRRAGS
jgi:hypothetical protein